MENTTTKTGDLVKGLRLLRTSNILSIIAMLIAILGTFALAISMGIGAGGEINKNVADMSIATLGVAGLGGLVALAGGIISIVAGIMGIVALLKAKSSHDGYKTALIFVALGIVFTFVTGFITMTGIINNIMTAVSLAIGFLVIYFVVSSTVVLLNNKGNSVLAEQGLSVRKLYIICTSIVIIAELLQGCPFLINIGVLAAIIALAMMVASIVQIVALFKYIGFLGRSATALEG